MACYHPLRLWIIGTKDNGKMKTVVTSHSQEYLQVGTQEYFAEDSLSIPCGQCVGCRLEYSRQWASRCMLESKYHDENYFLTLTYDEEHVPHSEYVDMETGEIKDILTLHKKDLQDFNKRLRSALSRRGDSGFRFYACGEYGSLSARPHYHMIAFGLHLDDLIKYKDTKTGTLYNSPFLDKIWKNGHVVVGSVTFESCAYVSRYIMKKKKGQEADVYDYYNITPEFTVMSRKPGLARLYFEEHSESMYQFDGIVLPGGRFSQPPRYFDKLMEAIDEDLMYDIKLNRRDVAEAIQESKLYISDASLDQQLIHAENNKNAQIKKLARPL